MGYPVSWFEVTGPDAKRLRSFYRRVFRWQMTPLRSGGVSYVAPERGGIGGSVAEALGSESSVTLFIEVKDLTRHLQDIEAAGGRTAIPPLELPNGAWLAAFIDPGGNRIGLFSPGRARKKRVSKARARSQKTRSKTRNRSGTKQRSARPKRR